MYINLTFDERYFNVNAGEFNVLLAFLRKSVSKMSTSIFV